MRSVLLLAAFLGIHDDPPYVGTWGLSPQSCKTGERTLIIRRDGFTRGDDPSNGCTFERVQPLDDDAWDVVAECGAKGQTGIERFKLRMNDEELSVERPGAGQGAPLPIPMTRCDDD